MRVYICACARIRVNAVACMCAYYGMRDVCVCVCVRARRDDELRMLCMCPYMCESVCSHVHMCRMNVFERMWSAFPCACCVCALVLQFVNEGVHANTQVLKGVQGKAVAPEKVGGIYLTLAENEAKSCRS